MRPEQKTINQKCPTTLSAKPLSMCSTRPRQSRSRCRVATRMRRFRSLRAEPAPLDDLRIGLRLTSRAISDIGDDRRCHGGSGGLRCCSLRYERRQWANRGVSNGREARAGALSSSGRGRRAALGNEYPLRRKSLNRRGFVSIVGGGALLASDRGDWCRFLRSGERGHLRGLRCLWAEY